MSYPDDNEENQQQDTLPGAQQITQAMNPNPQVLRDQVQLQQMMQSYKDLNDRMNAPAPLANPELVAAQNESQDTLRNAALGRAFSQIGAGIAGLGAKAVVTPNVEAFAPMENLAKQSLQNVKDRLEEQRKQQAEQRDKAKMLFDVAHQQTKDMWDFDAHKRDAERFATEQKQAGLTYQKGQQELTTGGIEQNMKNIQLDMAKQESDAKGPLSILMHNYLTKKYPTMDIPAGLNALQLKDVIKNLKDDEAAQEYKRISLELRGKMLELATRAEDRKAEAFDWRKVQHDELSDKQTESIAGYDKLLGLTDSILAKKQAIDTGPLAARQSSIAQFFGIDDSKKSAFKADVTDNLSQYIKSLSGLTVSDRERQALMNVVPKMEDNDQTFMTKLKSFQDRVNLYRSTELKAIQSQGKNIDTFPSKEAYDSSQVIVRSPQGKMFKAPRKNMYHYINQGYTYVPAE